MSHASRKWTDTQERLEREFEREPTVEEIEDAMIEEMAHEIEAAKEAME